MVQSDIVKVFFLYEQLQLKFSLRQWFKKISAVGGYE